MKIDTPLAPALPHSLAPKTPAAQPAATPASTPAAGSAPSVAHIHRLPSPPASGDFDAARVAAIREDIRAGRYTINPERIADGLLASVDDLLDRQGRA